MIYRLFMRIFKALKTFLSTLKKVEEELPLPHINFSLKDLKRTKNRMIITYYAQDVVRSLGADDHKILHTPIVISTLPFKKIKELLKDSTIKSIEIDQEVKALGQTQDWGIHQENVPSLWAKGFTGKGIKIAVIDTGVGPHRDIIVSGGASFVKNALTYNDDNGHGTHVAGIISAENNKEGVIGVAPNSEIYSVKVLDKLGSGYTSNIIKGIDWAISNKMDIINLSLGYAMNSYAMEVAINHAIENGILVVAAAGNSGNSMGLGESVSYPAAYPSVLAVAAIDSHFIRAPFSSTGKAVDICAPGVDIYSTFLKNSYKKLSGTSMACPFVAGQLALLKEKHPTLSALALKEKLLELTYDIGPCGVDPLYGRGPAIFREDPNVKTGLPIRTCVTITKSVETISSRGAILFKVVVKDENGAVLKGASVQSITASPKGSLYEVDAVTNANGECTITIQGYGGYQTRELGTYLFTVNAYKSGYAGATSYTTFEVE